MKAVGDRDILETYLNSVSKNTSETGIFPHRTKYLLTTLNDVCNTVDDGDGFVCILYINNWYDQKSH